MDSAGARSQRRQVAAGQPTPRPRAGPAGSERPGWLESLRAGDAALAADVEALLAEAPVSRRRSASLSTGPATRPPRPWPARWWAPTRLRLADRPGRDGQRLAGRAQRRPVRRRGRGEAPERQPGRAETARPGSAARAASWPACGIRTSPTSSTRASRRWASPTSCSSTWTASASTAYCDARGLGVEARIRLFLDVLAAVAHAHANLVVHRDLKPSNVLVARGRPRRSCSTSASPSCWRATTATGPS